MENATTITRLQSRYLEEQQQVPRQQNSPTASTITFMKEQHIYATSDSTAAGWRDAVVKARLRTARLKNANRDLRGISLAWSVTQTRDVCTQSLVLIIIGMI